MCRLLATTTTIIVTITTTTATTTARILKTNKREKKHNQRVPTYSVVVAPSLLFPFLSPSSSSFSLSTSLYFFFIPLSSHPCIFKNIISKQIEQKNVLCFFFRFCFWWLFQIYPKTPFCFRSPTRCHDCT